MNKYSATLDWIVGNEWNGQLLRLFLREHCQLSRKTLTEIKFKGGLILLNDTEVTVRSLVQEGDRVTVHLPAEKASVSMNPEDRMVEIIYEDEHLLVIHKEAGMPTIPSRDHPQRTLAHALLGYYEKIGHPATFHAVNRLDKDTSGLLLVAKHRFAHDRLSKLTQAGKVQRFYDTFIEGKLYTKEGTICAPIARHEDSIILRKIHLSGQRAVTHYDVKAVTESFTYVEARLETGRTHQIRVHFSYLGHPLVGDSLYGGSHDQIGRQALHCSRIKFEHPFKHTILTFQQPLPQDMKLLIAEEI